MNQSTSNRVHMDNIIVQTFDLVKLLYSYQNMAHLADGPFDGKNMGSRLVFPRNRKDKTRLCEQELRFVFVEVFNRYVELYNLNWFYSVEMPTKKDYGFSGGGQRNALFDLSIMDGDYNLVALIEFKANNPVKKNYDKDLKKLANSKEGDYGTLRYFLQIVDHHNVDSIDSINKKTTLINVPSISVDKTRVNTPIHIRVYSLSIGKEIINKIIS